MLVVSARTTLEGAAKSANLFVLQASFFVSWCLHAAGFPCPWWYQECVVLWIGYQLLQSPLTAASLKVLLGGGPMGVQHFSSVFHVVSDGTISRFSLATRCSWCSAGVLEGSVTWSHLSVSPPFVALFVPCAAGMRRGHGCSLWPQGVRPLIGRLTSNCSTVRHFTVPHEAVISGLAPESTCCACKVRSVYFADEARKLLHHLGTVLASCLSATVLGLSKKPLGMWCMWNDWYWKLGVAYSM